MQAIHKFDSDAPGEVVVAGARQVQLARHAGVDGTGLRGICRNGAQSFEGLRDGRPGESVKAMATLVSNGKQSAVEELGQVAAGGLRGDLGEKGEFPGGASAPIK